MPEEGSAPIVVVGTGVAGVTAAESARAHNPDVPVVLLSKESSLPYYRLRLIELFDGVHDPASLLLHPAGWYADAGIDLRLSTAVESLDMPGRRLCLSGGATLPYSALVLASGSSSFLPPVEGSLLPGVHTLWTLEDALSIRDALPSARRAVVIGGGLLGLESAYRFSQKGLAVTMVEMVPRLLPNQLDPEGSRFFEIQVRSLGIAVRTGTGVARIEGADHVHSVTLEDGTILEADRVLFAVGVRPNLGFLAGSGIAVGRRISVDTAMRTNLDGVYAAGDVAEVDGRWAGVWPVARAQGRTAGVNAAGGDERVVQESSPYYLNTMGTRVFSIGVTGSGSDAAPIGDAANGSEIYRDEGTRVYRKLVFQKDRLVGAVLVGGAAAGPGLSAAVRDGMARQDALKAGFLDP